MSAAEERLRANLAAWRASKPKPTAAETFTGRSNLQLYFAREAFLWCRWVIEQEISPDESSHKPRGQVPFRF